MYIIFICEFLITSGAGESGKSTLVKQMKIIHSSGFSQAERSAFRPTMLDNLLASMKYVLAGMGRLRINLQDINNKVFLLLKTIFSDDCFNCKYFFRFMHSKFC